MKTIRPLFCLPGLVAACRLAALAVAAFTLPTVWAVPAQQAYVKASNTRTLYEFGWSVAVSGDTMVVGARNEYSNASGVNGTPTNYTASLAGAAYVFVRDGTNWTQQAYLKASNARSDSYFGWSVAVSGDTVVVGAPWEASNATGVNGIQTNYSAPYAGAAYVFVRRGTNWSQQAYLKGSNTDPGDGFGAAVAVSGDTVVVGAGGEDSNASGVNGNQRDNSALDSGAAYVFVRSGTNWSQQAYLKASNPGGGDVILGIAGDLFGLSVAASKDTVVVGSRYEASHATGVNGDPNDNSAFRSGAAYVFVRNGTNWSQQAYLKASNTGIEEYFGLSVALSGDTVVVGAHYENSNATGVNGNQSDNSAYAAGAAYVFVRNGTNWIQQAYLKACNTGEEDLFGYSVAVSDDMVAVGAVDEASNAIGVNGDQSDNSAQYAGAAYLFVRRGTNWIQQAYLKASNTEARDAFGASVALSGETVVVGTIFEASNATGVNGDQSNNSADNAGAAYVFTGFCPACPSLRITPERRGGYVLRFTGAPGVTYRLLRASSPTGPWYNLAILTAPASGLLEFHDRTAPFGQDFYRTAQP